MTTEDVIEDIFWILEQVAEEGKRKTRTEKLWLKLGSE